MLVVRLAALAAGSIAILSAGLIPVSQTRQVSILGDVGVIDVFPVILDSFADSESAPDFGPFNVTLNDSVVSGVDPTMQNVNATAHQNSTISPTAVNLSGSAVANVFVFFQDGLQGYGLSKAKSTFELVFDLAQTEVWWFDASVLGSFLGEAFVRLERIDAPELIAEAFTDDFIERTTTKLVTLAPGQYRISAAGGEYFAQEIGIGNDNQSGEYNLRFALIPEPTTITLIGAGLIALLAFRRQAFYR